MSNPPATPPITQWPALVRQGYEEIVNAIIRPPRAQYTVSDLGPRRFTLKGFVIERDDFQITNDRGQALECSHWAPTEQHRFAERLPCVIVLHGNAGCRVEAIDALPAIIGAGATCCAVDLAGSGLSEGETISLGWFERDDVACLIAHLRDSGTVSTIGLWGRSMGAVTALLHGHRDPSIGCFILDSPFASLSKLSDELVDMVPLSIPRFAVGMVRRMVRSSVRTRAGFDINELDPVKHAVRTFIPALFVHATGDKFILPHHTDEIHEAYCGEKNKITFPGDHNSPRPSFFFDSAGIWIQTTLLSPDDVAARDALLSRLDPAPYADAPRFAQTLGVVPGGAPQLGVGVAMDGAGAGGAHVRAGGDDSDDDAELQRAIALSLLASQPDSAGAVDPGPGDDEAALAAALAASARESDAAGSGPGTPDSVGRRGAGAAQVFSPTVAAAPSAAADVLDPTRVVLPSSTPGGLPCEGDGRDRGGDSTAGGSHVGAGEREPEEKDGR